MMHPTYEQLKLHASGALDDVQAIMVAVHLHHCDKCRQQLLQLEQDLASQSFVEAESVFGEQELSVLMERLDEPVEIEPMRPSHSSLSFQGREFSLPPHLYELVLRTGSWTRIVNKLWSAPIRDHDQDYQLNFIYIEPGGSIAQHTHKGLEWTLVLDGSFSDEKGHYGPGELLRTDGELEHTPVSEQGCLCLAAIDAPLQFTSGIARALNPFSQLFFKTGG